jgi:hypothetical protein
MEQGSKQRQAGDNRTPDKTIGQVKYADDQGGNGRNRQSAATRNTSESDSTGNPDDSQQGEPTDGPEAQRRRTQMSAMEKAEGEMPRANPDLSPNKKKTGEF